MELIFIFMTTSLQWNLMNLVIVIEILAMKYKDKNKLKKRFVVNLLELILMKHILKCFQIHKQNE